MQISKSAERSIVPGLLLTSGLAFLATVLQNVSLFKLLSPLIIAIFLGIFVRNTIKLPKAFQPGITFSLKRLLRLAIILLGLQLSLSQVLEVGSMGLTIVIATLISSLIFTYWLGQRLGISQNLTHLIAAGTSICGASAIVATNSVVKTKDEDVTYAVAIITVFGTLSLLLYPLISMMWLHLTPQEFGIWCGSSIHEVAQVVAAAFQDGQESGQIAVVSKLSRVVFLAPEVLTLGLLSLGLNRKDQKIKLNQLPIPWFVLGFIALMLINSLNLFPVGLKASIIQSNRFLLTIALAAMGLETNLHKFKAIGLKPLYLGAASWLFISIFSLGLITIVY